MARENAYSFESHVRYSEVDEASRITLPSIINYFQDCSIFQSEALGVGLNFLAGIGHVWLLSSWQVEVRRYPRLGEPIRIYTWAHDFHGFLGSRNFCIVDGEGEGAVLANSLWSYLDLKAGRPVRPSPHELALYGLGDPLPLEKVSRKIACPDKADAAPEVTASRCQIDTNGHVNNCQYVQMALDAVDADLSVKKMRVEYKKAAVLHDRILPKVGREPDRIVVQLSGISGEDYAVVEFTEERKGEQG